MSRLISLLDRYLISELLLPFLFGVGMFTGLGLSIGALFDVMRKVVESGLSFAIALEILVLKLPEFLVLGFPMAMLLASLMAYSSLSSQSEIIALRGTGISPYRLIVPCLIFGIAVSGVTFFFNDFVVPQSNFRASNILHHSLKEERVNYQDKNIIYPEYQQIELASGRKKEVLKTLFYAERFDGKLMSNITILDRSDRQSSRIINAKVAQWDESNQDWLLKKGTIYQIDNTGSYNNIAQFQQQIIDLPKAPLTLALKCTNPTQMNLQTINLCIKNLALSRNEKRIRSLQVTRQERFSIPFVCIVFSLMGSAVGIRPQNASKATSVGLSVVIVFAYYLISFVSSSMGIWGAVSPFLATWFPNFLGLGAGIWFMVRSR